MNLLIKTKKIYPLFMVSLLCLISFACNAPISNGLNIAKETTPNLYMPQNFNLHSFNFIDRTHIQTDSTVDGFEDISHIHQDPPIAFRPNQIIFTDQYEIVTGSLIKYREINSSQKWKYAFNHYVQGSHATTWDSNKDEYYTISYMNKTENYDGPTNPKIYRYSSISDKTPDELTLDTLYKPHYIIYNPNDGYVYFVDADYGNPDKYLYRFNEFAADKIERINLLDKTNINLRSNLKEQILSSDGKENSYEYKNGKGYVRSLSIINGKLYIINSSHGEVIRLDELDNFSDGNIKFTRFRNYTASIAPAGTYASTKVTLNHIEYYNGFWYGANFFHKDFNEKDTLDYHEYNLVRWKTWDDFENSRFTDLSYLITDNRFLPYHFTKHEGKLFIGTVPNSNNLNDTLYNPIYILSPYNGDLAKVTYTTPLYRYWNNSAGDHFYTTECNQPLIGNNYEYEGIQCYVPTSDSGTIPLYRYWNESIKDHFYTTTKSAPDNWEYEGIQCNVYPKDTSNETTNLFRYWNAALGDHFYETNWSKLEYGKNGWEYEGVQCDVVPYSSLINK